MVISNKRKYLFISTPKTGTHSMYKLLTTELDGERYGKYHEREVPNKCKDYFKFTTCRNPYDRLVSAWNSLLNTTADYNDLYKRFIKATDFESFVEWATDNKQKLPTMTERGVVVVCPQSLYLGKLTLVIDKFVKIEDIDSEINNLDFVKEKVDVPHLLKREHGGWDELKNDNILAHANEFLKEDFELLDYEKEG